MPSSLVTYPVSLVAVMLVTATLLFLAGQSHLLDSLSPTLSFVFWEFVVAPLLALIAVPFVLIVVALTAIVVLPVLGLVVAWILIAVNSPIFCRFLDSIASYSSLLVENVAQLCVWVASTRTPTQGSNVVAEPITALEVKRTPKNAKPTIPTPALASYTC
ncbi:hypothetical protein OPQ81_003972 [Rhizoctonia solani]|nr:hypothetical protein OPQ81_003972 [Rhizoctonia solani]